MTIIETIAARRSIRKFTVNPVSDKEIEQILTSGMNAPTAGNQRSWHFIVVKDKERLKQIAEILPNGPMLPQAAAAIVVLADLSLEKHPGYWVVDCSAVIENMLLAIQSLKLGGVWLGVYPRTERILGLEKLFNLPDNIKPHSVIALGHPAETKAPNNNYNQDRVHLENW
jgi:nitroreductase